LDSIYRLSFISSIDQYCDFKGRKMKKVSVFSVIWLLVFICYISSVSGNNVVPKENSVIVNGLRARITSPSAVMPNEYFEVSIYVRNNVIPIDLMVDSITVQIYGGGISWTDDIASNMEIVDDWEYNKTAVVKTYRSASEGTSIYVRLEFHFMDRYSADAGYVNSATVMKITKVGTESEEDITELSEATGWDARLIALEAMAARLTQFAEVQTYTMVILAAITVLFASTTVYYARKSKSN
jgi:hypothetical protein